ncbi:MAG: DUF305 domain-containing protein [Actinomycetota bacterium]|nr:DUF305 domain-containing protein [Actinomycetota bacterium]
MTRLPASVLAVTTALLLAGCGGTSTTASSSAPATGSSAPVASSPSAPTAAHNPQDVTFIRDMIVHHASAIEMAKLAEQRAGSAEVKALAQRIEQAQAPEIQIMSGWLRSWNEPVPDLAAAMSSGGHGGGHGGRSAMGGMDPADMQKLMTTRGAEFDRVFLQMMTEHHQDAVEMGRTEQAQGQFGPAQQLAGEIVRTQSAEIDQMRGLLAKL